MNKRVTLRYGHKADGSSKLARLTQRTNVINGDLEDIVHCGWLQECSELEEIQQVPKQAKAF